jgi:16S rRNA (adenine1518-N6/adenine1519-N6)-dimethyltransferase
MRRREQTLFEDLDTKVFFQMVKAGFSARRKKLRSSLAGGLRIDKPQAEQMLVAADIDIHARAEDLTLEQWYRLAKTKAVN